LSYDELCRNLAIPGPLAWESCIALGRLASIQSLEKLVELTKNADWRYRRIFLTDKVETVKRAASWALKSHATQENWQKLFMVWHVDPLSRHRRWACELAQAFEADSVKKELELLRLDKDGHVRKAAARASRVL
jgi:hypothetical protein